MKWSCWSPPAAPRVPRSRRAYLGRGARRVEEQYERHDQAVANAHPKSEQRNSNVEERMVDCAKEPTCQCPEQNFSDTHKKEADLLEVNQMQISVCVSVNQREREGTDQSSTTGF